MAIPRWSREGLIFTAATAIIMLQILIDELVVLEPGASRADHLAAAGIPLAVAALAVWAYPRLRAGFRASLSLLFGILALVRAGIALAALDTTLRADDWAALALLPAGLVLIGLGGLVLWRSRRTEGHRYLRPALYAVAGALVAFYLVVPVGMALVATHRTPVSLDADELGLPHEDVTMETSDGLVLSGWYVPSENGAAVVTVPRVGSLDHARMLAAHGYGVLLLDLRGYEESQGDPNMFGWQSARDVDAAVAFLGAQTDVDQDRIGGLGLSVGGEIMLETAADNEGLAAVVSEGAGLRSVRESLLREGPGTLQKLLQWPQDAVLTGATAVMSGDAPPPSLEEHMAAISPRAVFLLYGEQGQEVEQAFNPPYYREAGEPKELWEIPGAGHTAGLEAQPAEYERRVIEFFDAHLGAE